MMTKAEEEANL